MGTQGCIPLIIGAAAGAGGVAFVRGKLEKNLDADVKSVHKATIEAFNSLDILVMDDDLINTGGSVYGMDMDDRKVSVDIDALTENASKIGIRVGTLGDEDRSLAILNVIQKKL